MFKRLEGPCGYVSFWSSAFRKVFLGVQRTELVVSRPLLVPPDAASPIVQPGCPVSQPWLDRTAVPRCERADLPRLSCLVGQHLCGWLALEPSSCPHCCMPPVQSGVLATPQESRVMLRSVTRRVG